jgi:hypothetical protein
VSPALPRPPDIRPLVAKRNYFIPHALCQSGKTTIARAAVDRFSEKGSYYALYRSGESSRNYRTDLKARSYPHRPSLVAFSADFGSRPDFIACPVEVWLSSLLVKTDSSPLSCMK